MNKTSIFSLVAIFYFIANSEHIAFAQDEYRSPNFKVELEGIKDLESGENIGKVSGYLNRFALNLTKDPKEQAKALALAWACAKSYSQQHVAYTDFLLRLGEFPEDSSYYEGVPSEEKLATVSEQILELAQQLAEEVDTPSKKLAGYLFDLLKNPQCPNSVVSNAKAAQLLTPASSWVGVLTYSESSQTTATTPDDKDDKVNQVVMSSTINKDGIFAVRQSLIKGLLVKGLGGADFAGMASQMNATLSDGKLATAPTEIQFNQDVGELMVSALGEVQKFLSVRHDGFPAGKKIEIAFEEQYSSKDGPSAAVACGLLLDALITGEKYDPAFAVTGDMNADGSVQPVGGIDGKIRGAAKRDCTHVAIPLKNASILNDMAVINDLSPLAIIQVFSISSFDQAKALALTPEERDENLQKAISTFAEVQKVLLRPNGMNYLKNSHVQQRIATTLKLAPNHLSAKVLLMKSQGRIPKLLSLKGSFTQIDRATKPIIAVLESGDLDNAASSLKDAIYGIRRIRSQLDSRARSCADSLEDLSNDLSQLSKSKLGRQNARYQELLRNYHSSLEKVRSEYNKLASDPNIQEELIK